MEVDPALVALGGVIIGALIGALATMVAARRTAESNAKIAREDRERERKDRISELIAEGYVAALEAIQWLSTLHVEDSVDPQFEAEYGPKTERAVTKLRAARQSILKAAALGGDPPVPELAAETAVVLNTLDHAWHDCQDYRQEILAGKKSVYGGLFDKAYERLKDARERLTGFPGDTSYRKQIDEGTVTEGSLLYRLREANSQPH